MGVSIVEPIPAPFDPNLIPPPDEVIGFDPNTPPSMGVMEGMGRNNPDGGFGYASTNGNWTADYAKRVVLSDFDRASSYRQTNHESRWQKAAELYLAYNSGRNVWPGTRIPRANMQVFLIFQQIEALLPQIVEALTGNDLDFDVESAMGSTTISQCHLVRDLINFSLRSLGGSRTKFLGWRECVRRMVKEGLIFGNGVAEWGWEGPYHVPEMKWEKMSFPEYSAAQHWTGARVMTPTGRTITHMNPTMGERLVNQFWMDPCALLDFYLDPATRGPNIQEGEYAIRRHLMPVAALDAMREAEGFRIPSLPRLIQLSRRIQWSQGDTTRQAIAAAHGESSEPLDNPSLDPLQARVEVFRYFSKGKHIWLLGREDVVKMGENQYGALPFSNWTYVDVPGSAYGLSIPDICETDQELAKQLLDGRLDEVNLMLHPPTVTKRGLMRSQSQSRLRPGANWEADDPGKDVVRLEMGNVTQSAYVEMESLEQRVQKKTGVTDLAILGSPSSRGNSANRTATGVAAQTNASNSRIHYLVANFEDQTVQPILETIWTLSRQFMPPEQLIAILGSQAQLLQTDPLDLYNADPRFVMKTAQRMKMRAGLQGGGLNLLLQYFLNPEIGTLMGEEQGTTIDVQSISELYCDTFNLRAQNFFRPMTPQEQQAKAQRMQAPIEAKLNLQQVRLDAMERQAHDRDEAQMIEAIIKALGQAGYINQVVGITHPVELEAKRLDAEIAGGMMQAPSQAQGES